jgi:hypothetical protein
LLPSIEYQFFKRVVKFSEVKKGSETFTGNEQLYSCNASAQVHPWDGGGTSAISPLGFLKNVLHELCNKIIQNGIIYTLAWEKFLSGY